MRIKNLFLASAVALSLPLAALAQTAGSMSGPAAPMTGPAGSAQNSPTAPSSPNATLNAGDQKFILTAARAGMAEVQDGQLAVQKGSPAVQQVGQKMVDDHTKANNQLMAIAQSDGVTLPTSVTAAQASMTSKLQGLSGSAFDAAYLKGQKAAHMKAIKLFQTEASSGTDAQLKSFAANTLPILKMHLQMIESTNSSTQS